MADTLSTVIDGHEVIVDVGGLAGVAHTTMLVPTIVAAVVVAGIVGVKSRPGQRALLLGALGSGALGAAAALLSAPVVYGRIASWVEGLSERISAGSVVVGVCGFCCGALLWLGGSAFAILPRRSAVVLAAVSAVFCLVGSVGIAQVQAQRRTFIRGLHQAFPVPQLVFEGQAGDELVPEVQVGQQRLVAPVTWRQLAAPPPTLLGVVNPDAIAFPAADVTNWNLGDVRATLSAATAGEQTTTATATQGPVSVRSRVRFRAVADRSPAHFSLTPGARHRFARVRGPVGSVAARLKQDRAKLVQEGDEQVVVSVESERVEDGFRVAIVHINDGGQRRTEEVVAKDGVLYRTAGNVFVGADCALPFLEFFPPDGVHKSAGCVCNEGVLDSCIRVEDDRVGSMVRVGLLIATLGMSEVVGTCPECGAGKEIGILRLPKVD